MFAEVHICRDGFALLIKITDNSKIDQIIVLKCILNT